MATVAVKDLCKSYASTQTAQLAVKNVNFSMPDRAFLTLLGPSGCGKSTILRMIAGLEEISSGEILIDGQRINDLSPAQRDVGMVFQSYALYPHMTCFENMAVSLRLRKLPEKEIKQRIGETAELLAVTKLLDRKPKQLSGGERQRIALGRAIVRQPKVLLLDEPLSNLDAQLRERMRTELKKLFIDMGATIIYVTHDQAEAMSMSDTIVVLKEGVLQQQGSPQEIYHQPANVFIAGFMGSPRINTISGTLENGQFISNDLKLANITLKNLPTTAVNKVLLAARPEHIDLHAEQKTDAIAGRIELLEPLGMHTKVIVIVGQERLSVLTNQTSFSTGQAVWLSFQPQNMLFFSADNGLLISEAKA